MNDKHEPDEQGKYIGAVKWFHDNTRNANYGFIRHATIGDLFFHEKSIESGQALSAFKENEIVVFSPRISTKHEGKFEAIQVKLLSFETNIVFLFGHFLYVLLEKGKYSDYVLIQKAVHARITLLLKDQADTQINISLFDTYQTFVKNHVQLENSPDITFLKGLLNVCKSFFPEQYTTVSNRIGDIIPIPTAHQLWLDGFLAACQVDFILTFFLQDSLELQRKILFRCSVEDKANIFLKSIRKLAPVDNASKFNEIKSLLMLIKEHESDLHHLDILRDALNTCTVKYKIILWLEDYHQELDFESYKPAIPLLSPPEQVKFVKKVLNYIHTQKVYLSVDDLTSINVMNYKTSKLVQGTDVIKLDYSTSIMLNTILELKNQTQLENRKQELEAKNRMYNLILNNITDPSEILEIRGFFDKCEGRCTRIYFDDLIDDFSDDGDVGKKYIRNTFHKPHLICDGRKALQKDGTPTLDESNMEFWWCANNKCYQPSRKLHSPDMWNDYSLLDFLTILKVPFQEKDYLTYLSTINKANRFLKHLKCRACNHILRPTQQSNYAFYGVNHFHCINEQCKNKNIEIYLTHCINSRCEHEIDSRDSVRCQHEGVDSEKYGWYVCTYCLACCSDVGIERRKYILSKTGQEYRGKILGHKEAGVISCDKCGHAMEDKNIDTAQLSDNDKYQRALMWLINDAKKPHSNVIKSGKNKHNQHWFRFSKANLGSDVYQNKLENLLKLGFHIPEFNPQKSIHLISEPLDSKSQYIKLLTCSHCNHVIDLTDDKEREYAITKYHSRYNK